MARPRLRPIAEVLQRLLEVSGARSLDELAQRYGWSSDTVRSWDKRGSVPRPRLEEFADRHGITVDEVLKTPNMVRSEQAAASLASAIGAPNAPALPKGSGKSLYLHLSATALQSLLTVAEDTPAPWKTAIEETTQSRGVSDGLLPPRSEGQSALLRTRGAEAVLPLVLSLPGGEGGPSRKYELIPQHTRTASAGPGGGAALADQVNLAGEMAFSFEWLRHNLGHTSGRLTTIQVRGDSMAKTLLDGDTVMIDEGANTFDVDGIYVFDFNGRRLIKRVQQMLDGSLELISDNPRYKPQTVARDHARDVRVVGRMVWPRV